MWWWSRPDAGCRRWPIASLELMPAQVSPNQPPETHVKAGEVPFEQSTMGDLIYVVSEGEFEIVRIGRREELSNRRLGTTCGNRRAVSPATLGNGRARSDATRRSYGAGVSGAAGCDAGGRPGLTPRACQRIVLGTKSIPEGVMGAVPPLNRPPPH